jgi:predicted ribosome quality control (RQC) complex YloA/Tae2 family protein
VAAFRQESQFGYRLVMETQGCLQSIRIVVSPDSPWIGRSFGATEGPRWSPGAFAAAVGSAVRGCFLASVEIPSYDRLMLFRTREGHQLVVELASHGAGMAFLDPEGRVLHAESRRSVGSRLLPGQTYRAPPIPGSKIVPREDAADLLEGSYREALANGLPPDSALHRTTFGLSRSLARFVVEEATARHLSPVAVLLQRLRDLRDGSVAPVVIGPEDPRSAASRDDFDPDRFLFVPWDPGDDLLPGQRFRRKDAAETAGFWFEALERSRAIRDRHQVLESILRREIERIRDAEQRARSDAARFGDPADHRYRGEAMLAGLAQVRFEDGHYLVADPRRSGGALLRIPGRPGMRPHRVAEEEFQRARRAERGIRTATERANRLAERRARLEALDVAEARTLAQAMQREGIPVGLRRGTLQQRRAAALEPPRLDGVRMATSRDGWIILVGKSGRENDRLTFKIASPDDFWLHALDVAGAHVVIRNPDRRSAPPPATLSEAASLAAWYSDARSQPSADVQWTRRKYVRRLRGAATGTVRVKRSRTVRVAPSRLLLDRGSEA